MKKQIPECGMTMLFRLTILKPHVTVKQIADAMWPLRKLCGHHIDMVDAAAVELSPPKRRGKKKEA